MAYIGAGLGIPQAQILNAANIENSQLANMTDPGVKGATAAGSVRDLSADDLHQLLRSGGKIKDQTLLDFVGDNTVKSFDFMVPSHIRFLEVTISSASPSGGVIFVKPYRLDGTALMNDMGQVHTAGKIGSTVSSANVEHGWEGSFISSQAGCFTITDIFCGGDASRHMTMQRANWHDVAENINILQRVNIGSIDGKINKLTFVKGINFISTDLIYIRGH